ncbi:MAG: response regulator [Saezia sp.]
MAKILIVDDELGIRELLSEILHDEGHTIEMAQNATEARQLLQKFSPDLVLLDIWMPDTDGVTLLKEWGSNGQLIMPVIMMSGHATIDTAVEATKIGAIAFLEKPITMQKLLKSVDQAINPVKPMLGVVAPQHSTSNNTVKTLQSTSYTTTFGSSDSYSPKMSEMSAVVPVSSDVEYMQPVRSFSLDKPLREARDEFETVYFKYHLFQEGGSMTRVAEKTGLERTHLYRKLKQLGIDLSKAKRMIQN